MCWNDSRWFTDFMDSGKTYMRAGWASARARNTEMPNGGQDRQVNFDGWRFFGAAMGHWPAAGVRSYARVNRRDKSINQVQPDRTTFAVKKHLASGGSRLRLPHPITRSPPDLIDSGALDLRPQGPS